MQILDSAVRGVYGEEEQAVLLTDDLSNRIEKSLLVESFEAEVERRGNLGNPPESVFDPLGIALVNGIDAYDGQGYHGNEEKNAENHARIKVVETRQNNTDVVIGRIDANMDHIMENLKDIKKKVFEN